MKLYKYEKNYLYSFKLDLTHTKFLLRAVFQTVQLTGGI